MAATNREDYTARQAQRDRDYEATFAKWFASLPPDERRKLKAQGLDKPDLDRVAKKANRSGDVSVFNLEDHSGESAEMPDTDHFPDAAQMVSAADLATALRCIGGVVAAADNRELELECIFLAMGLGSAINPEAASCTEADVARRFFVTRAAVSKRVVALTRKLHLSPSSVMRQPTLVHAYRTKRILSHLAQCQRSTPSTRPVSPSKKTSRSKI